MANLISVPVIISIVILFYGHAHSGNNTGQAFSLWPDTGQTVCYDATGNILKPCPAPGQSFHGQDAQYSGPKLSYSKLDATGNTLPESATSWAMVRDKVTGLIWEAKEAGDSIRDYSNPHDADNTYTWCDTNPDTNESLRCNCGATDTEDFLTALNNGPGFAGHTDWRLPTIKELETLTDKSRNNPAINATYFPLTVSPYYWSSTTYAGNRDYAWFVDFNNGTSDSFSKSNSYSVRAVRGGQVQPDNRFADNLDGTVTDTVTCLQWQQASADTSGDGNPDLLTWQDALAYAENLNLASYDDWRLPDINELRSIVDHEGYKPAIDITAFPYTESSNYWSSTTCLYYTRYAWGLSFVNGYDSGHAKSYRYYVRAVRGNQCGGLSTPPGGDHQFPVHLFLLLHGDNP